MFRNIRYLPSLARASWRYLLHHPWQTVLMVVGITLGVAVAVAIDLANASASRAFDLSTTAITGRATHQILAEPQGLPEQVYTRLILAGTGLSAAPVIDEYVTSPQLGGAQLQLLGVDPFAEAPFRDYLGSGSSLAPGGLPSAGPGTAGLAAFLTQPGAILLSTDLAERYGLAAGSAITIEVAGEPKSAFIAGLVQPASDPLSRRALDGLLLADIATAQEIMGRLGRLDRIDLILPSECQEPAARCPAIAEITTLLPTGASLLPVAARQGSIAEMTAAFRLNLTALSLLALLVGLFLIYNTMTFSVIQRRQLFGTLRCLGVTRREVFLLVLGEALVVGIIGTLFGLVLGVVLGQGAVRLVTQTINDLYFVVTVTGVQVAPTSLIKGLLLGILAPVFAAALPAYEAASVPPRAALTRASLESQTRRVVSWSAVLGTLLLAGSGLIFLLPTSNLVISFGGTLAVIIGFALLAPLATRAAMLALAPSLGKVWGSLGRMAPRDVVQALSRTSVAIAALMVAVAVTIGVSLMINSFRSTVITWLSQTLQGDVYVSAPGLTANRSTAILDPITVATAAAWPGVTRSDVLRSVNVDSPSGLVNIAASNNPDLAADRLYQTADGPPQAVQSALQAGAVMISEPLANRLHLPRRGAEITLFTAAGPQTFPVVAVYYDYSSSQGTVMMALDVYRQHWQDTALTAMALHLQPGRDADQLAGELSAAIAPTQRLVIRPNRVLRQEVLQIFDRTFAITGALQILATGVAFVGILSALLALQLERQRELGILRAIGLTVQQLWALVLAETGLMGLVAGLLAMPTGLTLALILIFVINRRSFGWTIQLQLTAEPFIQALAVAVLAALLAGVYPAYRLGRMLAADAIRFE